MSVQYYTSADVVHETKQKVNSSVTKSVNFSRELKQSSELMQGTICKLRWDQFLIHMAEPQFRSADSHFN